MPNRSVILVSCVSKKQSVPIAAKKLYCSTWFTKARHYAEQTGSPWFILSAEYGVVRPDEIIAPYERTLNKAMKVAERREWARRVNAQLAKAAPRMDRAVLLAGLRYREFLKELLLKRDVEVEVPMEGLTIGRQLRWLSRHGS